eukprot:3852410-Rhodomonas_salina.2
MECMPVLVSLFFLPAFSLHTRYGMLGTDAAYAVMGSPVGRPYWPTRCPVPTYETAALLSYAMRTDIGSTRRDVRYCHWRFLPQCSMTGTDTLSSYTMRGTGIASSYPIARRGTDTALRRDPEFFGRANKVEKGGAAAYLSWFRHVPKCKALAAQSKARLYLHASSSYFGNLAVPKRIKDLYPLALHTKLR